MKKLVILLVALVSIAALALGFLPRRTHATPDLKRVVLSAEESKALAEISGQLKNLAQQYQLVTAKGQGIVETYAKLKGFEEKKYKLTEVAPDLFAIEEIIEQPGESK